jgi:hypothetical protein
MACHHGRLLRAIVERSHGGAIELLAMGDTRMNKTIP